MTGLRVVFQLSSGNVLDLKTSYTSRAKLLEDINAAKRNNDYVVVVSWDDDSYRCFHYIEPQHIIAFSTYTD